MPTKILLLIVVGDPSKGFLSEFSLLQPVKYLIAGASVPIRSIKEDRRRTYRSRTADWRYGCGGQNASLAINRVRCGVLCARLGASKARMGRDG